MFIIFFTIVFIAEIIILYNILRILAKADCKVRNLNEQVESLKCELEINLKKATSGVNKASELVSVFDKFLDKRKKALFILLIKLGLGTVIFVLFKKFPNKKWFSIIDLIITLTNIFKIRI